MVRVDTDGGPQTMQALHLETVPLWLAGLEPSRVRAEVRPRLRFFKRWVRQRFWEAFAVEMGLSQAPTSAVAADATGSFARLGADTNTNSPASDAATSDTPGMAMVSEPIDIGGVKIHRPGTLIGKALEPLNGKQGDVLVLLSLQ